MATDNLGKDSNKEKLLLPAPTNEELYSLFNYIVDKNGQLNNRKYGIWLTDTNLMK